jgi:hypothetical protein
VEEEVEEGEEEEEEGVRRREKEEEELFTTGESIEWAAGKVLLNFAPVCSQDSRVMKKTTQTATTCC